MQKEAKRTVVVCANATCCHTFPLMLIRKYKWPVCFANQTCPLKYVAQCIKVCLDGILTGWNWSNEVFYPEVLKRTCYPVLLLMFNDPGYFEAFQWENVVVRYFITNITS